MVFRTLVGVSWVRRQTIQTVHCFSKRYRTQFLKTFKSYTESIQISLLSISGAILRRCSITTAVPVVTSRYVGLFCQGVAISESIVTRSTLVKTLSWHPTQMILAIGWQSGEITLQNMNDYSLHDVETHHKSNLEVMLWNCDGSHLLAGYSVRK